MSKSRTQEMVESAAGTGEDGHPLETSKFVLPEPFSWTELLKPVDNSENLLGNRFLERGQGLILFGPSGCGKSVAGLQAVAEWAAGLNGLHISPVGPLKTVVLQTEDSLNDTRESLAGIIESSVFTPDIIDLLKTNLIILPPVPGGTGRDLAQLLDAAYLKHKPDLFHVNPLLAYCPADPIRELGSLLYQVIDPIIKRHRVGFFAVHHTPKTNGKDTSGYGAYDYQYQAAGDARVANWPRAMIQIEPLTRGVYRFRAPKRGLRAGWTWDRQPTKERYFRHSEKTVRWIDASPEEASAAVTMEDYRRILEVLPNPDQPGISRERIVIVAKEKLKVGKNKAEAWLKLAQEDGAVERMEIKTDSKRTAALFRLKETDHAR